MEWFLIVGVDSSSTEVLVVPSCNISLAGITVIFVESHFNLVSCFIGKNLTSIGSVGQHINKHININQDKRSVKCK